MILSETMRMKELVDGILTISRLDSHDTRLRTEVISLGEFIEAQIDILQGLGIAEKVSIGMERSRRISGSVQTRPCLEKRFRM